MSEKEVIQEAYGLLNAVVKGWLSDEEAKKALIRAEGVLAARRYMKDEFLPDGVTQTASLLETKNFLWPLTILLDDMSDASCHRFGKLPRITEEQFNKYLSRQAYVRALIDAIREPDWSPSEPIDG
jgi:hypothetical protein